MSGVGTVGSIKNVKQVYNRGSDFNSRKIEVELRFYLSNTRKNNLN